MFQLTEEEKVEVVTKCDHLHGLKFSPQLPYVFTEHGAVIFKYLKQLISQPVKPRPRVGFRRKDEQD